MTKFGTIPAEVRALVVFDEDDMGPNPPRLFAGGDFQIPFNNIARWDGTAWTSVGFLGNSVHTLAVFDEDGAGGNPPSLFAGGDFPDRISRRTGSSWVPLGSGINNGTVRALAVYEGALYVGGSFSFAGGVNGANDLARWDGTNWSAVQSLGLGVDGDVYALHVVDRDGDGPSPPDLYVGGEFIHAGGVVVNRIARWDGTAWFRVGQETNPGFGGFRVYTIYGYDNGSGPTLFAGGDFTQIGGGTGSLTQPSQFWVFIRVCDGAGAVFDPKVCTTKSRRR